MTERLTLVVVSEKDLGRKNEQAKVRIQRNNRIR